MGAPQRAPTRTPVPPSVKVAVSFKKPPLSGAAPVVIGEQGRYGGVELVPELFGERCACRSGHRRRWRHHASPREATPPGGRRHRRPPGGVASRGLAWCRQRRRWPDRHAHLSPNSSGTSSTPPYLPCSPMTTGAAPLNGGFLKLTATLTLGGTGVRVGARCGAPIHPAARYFRQRKNSTAISSRAHRASNAAAFRRRRPVARFEIAILERFAHLRREKARF